MAFIYRANKDPNIFNISSSVVGPGEYLDKLPKFSPRQNHEPFLSSSDKFLDNKNETPGPGTYYKDTQKLNNLKNIQKSIHNKNMDLVVARVKKDIITLCPAEKLGFDTKAKRFISNTMLQSQSELSKTPGPGQYFPSILNSVKQNKKIKKMKYDKSNLNLLKTKSNFFPDKKCLSSVIIESNSKKENNKLRKTVQYDNFACRPKIFNIRKYKEIMEYNENNSLSSTNYSDQKNRTKLNNFIRTFNITGGFSNFNEINNSDNIIDHEGLKEKEIFHLYKKNDSENKNAMKFRINFCKKINKKNLINKLDNDFNKLLEGKSPGPGYYFDDIFNFEKQQKKSPKNNLQNYFTKEKRFYSLPKPWTHLGPGEYIKINNLTNKKTNLKDNPSNNEIPFGSNEPRNNTFLCLENTIDNPGPGKYEFYPFTDEIENEGIIDVKFGFTGNRFNDNYLMKDKYNSPGPGYYISKINTIGHDNKKYKQILMIPSKSENQNKIKKIQNIENNKFLNGKYSSLDEFKFRDKVPPVGYYYPEFFSTIEFKNKINLINSKNSDLCFNKSITKSLKKSDSAPNIVGPGYYNINGGKKESIHKNGLHPPFFSSAEKKSFPAKKKKYRISLDEIGKHYMKEYFNWNKKSFNVIFV